MRRLVRYKPSRLQITVFFVGAVVRKDAAAGAEEVGREDGEDGARDDEKKKGRARKKGGRKRAVDLRPAEGNTPLS